MQRYVVFDGFRHVTVVVCTGASSLGTLAAVQWAAEHLNSSVHPDGEPIPLPPNTRLNSRFEALIFVTADATQNRWQPARLELDTTTAHGTLRLEQGYPAMAARHAGRVHAASWKVTTPTIRWPCSSTAAKSPCGRGARASASLARAIQAAYTNSSGRIDIAQLAADPWIWGKHPVPEKDVRRGLSLLKFRYLHDVLSLDDQTCLRRPDHA